MIIWTHHFDNNVLIGLPNLSADGASYWLKQWTKKKIATRRAKIKERLLAVWWQCAKEMSQWISDFSQSPEHLHACLPLMKLGKLLSTSSANVPQHASVARQFLWLDWWALLTAPLPFCLKVSGFSSAEKEQARTGKMNDINHQPILPGTCDWDKWALLH